MSQPIPPVPPSTLEVIPAGQARATLLAALANYAAASGRVIELADAMARALDEQVEAEVS